MISTHISLGLVLHNHQPVGQADQVFEEVYERCYNMIVSALERHPGVRLGLHHKERFLFAASLNGPDRATRRPAGLAVNEIFPVGGPLRPTKRNWNGIVFRAYQQLILTAAICRPGMNSRASGNSRSSQFRKN